MNGTGTTWAGRALLLALAALVIPACGGGGLKKPTTNVISARGGVGIPGGGGDGGSGNYFQIDNYHGSDTRVLKTGSVDTSATVAIVAPYLGTNPLIVNADMTLQVGATGLNNANANVTNVTGTVTGIWVKPGVTLTILPNAAPNGAAPHAQVDLSVDNGILVEGTIRIGRQDSAVEGDGLGADTATFLINFVESLLITTSGVIDVSGANNVGGLGGNGGGFFCQNGDSAINAGTITTAGGHGDNGGQGGMLYLYANYGTAANLGTLRTDGGRGLDGFGGSANDLYFHADYYGLLVNRGLLSTRGGDGTDGGGNGGYTDLYTYYGSFVNSGSIYTTGGNATLAAANGSGGDGGSLYMYLCGSLRATGTWNTQGGNGAGSDDGGAGGDIDVYTDYNYSYGWGTYYGYGIAMGTTLVTDGGYGVYGGDAGYIYLYQYSEGYARPFSDEDAVILVGYSSINTSGGDGDVDGGNAESVYLYAYEDYDDNSDYMSGSVITDVPIAARGGHGTTGNGGDGAYCDFETEQDTQPTYLFGTSVASVDVSGGNGAISGGDAGYLDIYGKYFVEAGSLTANGGHGGSGDGGDGSGGDTIYIASDYTATISGSLVANGGSSVSADGGQGGDVEAFCGKIVMNGSLIANGGSGNAATGTGGDGGYAELFSQDGGSVFSGSASVQPGTGFVNGIRGDFWFDGAHLIGQ